MRIDTVQSKRNYLLGIRIKEPLPDDSYISALPAVRHIAENSLDFKARITFFVGENGTGKSTVLEAIAAAMGFNPEGGSRDYSFSTRDSHSGLYGILTLIRSRPPRDGFFYRAESFYNTATYLDENGSASRHGGRSLHEQSHGEALLALAANRFEGGGLYLLDEPEAALSPGRILSLMCIIDSLVKKDSQFIIATHSPILMAMPEADIMEFDEDGIRHTSYRETEHYKITRQFLEDPERMMRYLFEN